MVFCVVNRSSLETWSLLLYQEHVLTANKDPGSNLYRQRWKQEMVASMYREAELFY